MKLSIGRIAKITTFGHHFIDPQDGSNAEVFLSAKIIARCGAEPFHVGDVVEYKDVMGDNCKRFAASVTLVERAPQKPKPPTIKRTGYVLNDLGYRAFTFLQDDDNKQSIFLSEKVALNSRVQVRAGDRVEYEIDPGSPPSGKCPAAISVRLI